MAPFHVALAAAVLARAGGLRTAGQLILALATGSALGWLLSCGYWAWGLWERFGNPVFPFANDLFRSPFFFTSDVPPPFASGLVDGFISARDLRWRAHGVMDFLAVPFNMAIGKTSRLQEIEFRETRFALLSVVALVWLAQEALRRARQQKVTPLPAVGRGLLAYFLVAWVLWLKVFYYYRYALVLEFIAPLALCLLLLRVTPPLPSWKVLRARLRRPSGGAVMIPAAPRWRSSKVWVRKRPGELSRLQQAALLAATAVILLSARRGYWGRGDWTSEWFNVKVPAVATEPGAVVLMDGPRLSFTIPFFPPTVRFLNARHQVGERFDNLIRVFLDVARGPVLLMTPASGDNSAAVRFGYDAVGECEAVTATRVRRLRLCRLRPVADNRR